MDTIRHETDHLLVRDEGAVRWLTLNRPDRRNAIGPELLCRLADAWAAAECEDAVRVLVLTGAGAAFSAGADVRTLIPLLAGDRAPADEWDERVLNDPTVNERAMGKVPCDKPVIAAVNGTATGGGLELILAMPLRIAASSARFGLTEAKLGLIPGGGGLTRLPRQTHQALATELLLTGKVVTAEHMAALGVLNAVVPDDRVADAAREMANAIAANGPLATRVILATLRESDGIPIADAFESEARAWEVVIRSEDGREGPLAFAEKRAPNFLGR